MESIIATFHLDWKLIVAQLVNFAIVAGVLWFFVLKPLTTVMADRTATIEKSLRDAEAVKLQLRRAEEEKQAVIKEAHRAARDIIESAKTTAAEQQQQTIAATRQEVEKVIAASKEQLARDRQQLMADVQAQAADLVVLAAGRVLHDIVTKPVDRALAQQALASVASGDLRRSGVDAVRGGTGRQR